MPSRAEPGGERPAVPVRIAQRGAGRRGPDPTAPSGLRGWQRARLGPARPRMGFIPLLRPLRPPGCYHGVERGRPEGAGRCPGCSASPQGGPGAMGLGSGGRCRWGARPLLASARGLVVLVESLPEVPAMGKVVGEGRRDTCGVPKNEGASV